MAFKMKNPSMAKMVKEAGSAMKKPLVGDQDKLNEGLKKAIEASPAKSKHDRIIKRMGKLEDKAQKLNKKGKDKRAQRKIDKMSKLKAVEEKIRAQRSASIMVKLMKQMKMKTN